jgi:hypothetical protein
VLTLRLSFGSGSDHTERLLVRSQTLIVRGMSGTKDGGLVEEI